MPGAKDGWSRVKPGEYINHINDRPCVVFNDGEGTLWVAQVAGENTPGRYRFQRLDQAQRACEEFARGARRWKAIDRDEVLEAFTREQTLRLMGREAPDAEVLEAERRRVERVLIELANMNFVVAKAVGDAQG